MDYEQTYNRLIERARKRTISGYFESHHIVPKCIGGTNDPTNLVNLTAREHYIAHQLLVKIYPNSVGIARAAFLMSHMSGVVSNKRYERLREIISIEMKHNNPNKGGQKRRDYVQKRGSPVVNYNYVTDDWKQKCSDKKVGDKNPNYRLPPWLNVNQTEATLKVWKNAAEAYDWWLATNASYSRMQKHFRDKTAGPYMSLIKKFRQGWIPREDSVWKEWACVL